MEEHKLAGGMKFEAKSLVTRLVPADPKYFRHVAAVRYYCVGPTYIDQTNIVSLNWICLHNIVVKVVM